MLILLLILVIVSMFGMFSTLGVRDTNERIKKEQEKEKS